MRDYTVRGAAPPAQSIGDPLDDDEDGMPVAHPPLSPPSGEGGGIWYTPQHSHDTMGRLEELKQVSLDEVSLRTASIDGSMDEAMDDSEGEGSEVEHEQSAQHQGPIGTLTHGVRCGTLST
jgi:hypothetical protein